MSQKQSRKPRLTFGISRITRSGGLNSAYLEVAILYGNTLGSGKVQYQLDTRNPEEIELTGDRVNVKLENLAIGEHELKVSTTIADENSSNPPTTLSGKKLFTIVPPDAKLDVSTPAKIGNEWQATGTATVFIPGTHTLYAENESVEFYLDGGQVASLPTSEAGIATYDFQNLTEGKHVFEIRLPATGRGRKQTIQVGEKPSGPESIDYMKTSKLGSMGTTILRITVLNKNNTGVKNAKVQIEDPTLPGGQVEYEADEKGRVVHEVQVAQSEGQRTISITVPGTNLREITTFYWQTERVRSQSHPPTPQSSRSHQTGRLTRSGLRSGGQGLRRVGGLIGSATWFGLKTVGAGLKGAGRLISSLSRSATNRISQIKLRRK